MILKSKMTFGLSLVLALFFASSCALSSGGFTVTGQIKDTSGATVKDVSVSMPEAGITAVTTDAEGKFEITGVPYGTFEIVPSKTGKVFIIGNPNEPKALGNTVAVTQNNVQLTVTAVDADKVTIPLIQGSGLKSPLVGQRVVNVRGVVTKVTKKAPHAVYETVREDGSTTPQWVSEDGFFMEAFNDAASTDKDGNPETSDGIFVYTHNDAFEESKWLNTCPTDLKEGDVVIVSGLVREYKPVDRFNNSNGYLTVTQITEPVVFHQTNLGVNETRTGQDAQHGFPAGVLLTYAESLSELAGGVLPSGVTEWRTMPWNKIGPLALANAISVMESVEGMIVRVDYPIAASHTYYGVTGLLADDARKGTAVGAAVNPNFNQHWGSVVLQDPADGMDFNTELLFVDYASPTWSTFSPLPQPGDHLRDSNSGYVLRGVMNYTADGSYMIQTLQHSAVLRDAAGNTVYKQGWAFVSDRPQAGHTTCSLLTDANWLIKDYDAVNVDTAATATWRIGSGADTRFLAPWAKVTGTADTSLRIASYNIENYSGQGLQYDKVGSIADIVINNLKAPDVFFVVEMGDDKETITIFANQFNAYAIPDGVTTCVLNMRGLALKIKELDSSLDYDFRVIDPEELKDGGEPGTNIRVGMLFRTDRIAFVDSGIPTNTLATTAGANDTWPVPDGSEVQLQLARLNTSVYKDSQNEPHLTQSPGRILGSAFGGGKRKSIVAEMIFKPTGETFFAIGAHLGSKTGDTPLYGEQQPPAFGSDASRTRQGEQLNAFVESILSINPDASVVVAGDMNDFQFGPSLLALSGKTKGNQILYGPSEEYLNPNERFTYSFRGNFQQIDHIFVSKAMKIRMDANGGATQLANQTDLVTTNDWNATDIVFIPHINSPFSKNNHVQLTDHDPETVRAPM